MGSVQSLGPCNFISTHLQLLDLFLVSTALMLQVVHRCMAPEMWQKTCSLPGDPAPLHTWESPSSPLTSRSP